MSKLSLRGLPDPSALAKRQVQIDRARTQRFRLGSHKCERMALSPLAFLRGSAPLFYEILKAEPALAEGPAGEGWIVGDLHVENFGAYRSGDGGQTEKVVFAINDFDDAAIGPFRYDLLRLTTSLLLGLREFSISGAERLRAGRVLLDSYAEALAGGGKRNLTAPRCVTALLDQATERTHVALLDARTKGHGEKRRFVRGPRYRNLPASLAKQAEGAFAGYVEKLNVDGHDDAYEVLDLAFRVAGTGSLGSLRIAVLTRGKGGRDGGFIFDMKEEDAPSAEVLLGADRRSPADRVIEAARSCLDHPPRQMGSAKIGATSLLVRRLSPQEDKLDWRKLGVDEIVMLSQHLGALVGASHRRGAHGKPKSWAASDREAVLERALCMAGIHEATYLAFLML